MRLSDHQSRGGAVCGLGNPVQESVCHRIEIHVALSFLPGIQGPVVILGATVFGAGVIRKSLGQDGNEEIVSMNSRFAQRGTAHVLAGCSPPDKRPYTQWGRKCFCHRHMPRFPARDERI